jgi:hypothetical protein
MDQRPRNELPPRDAPLTDDLGRPRTRTTWDRATRTEQGDWNVIPLLLVAALGQTRQPRGRRRTRPVVQALDRTLIRHRRQRLLRRRLRHRPQSHNKLMLLFSSFNPAAAGFFFDCPRCEVRRR